MIMAGVWFPSFFTFFGCGSGFNITLYLHWFRWFIICFL